MNGFFDDVPDMDPIVSYEETSYGWRGLTGGGEVFEVRGENGHRVSVPESTLVAYEGRPIGRRRVTNELRVDINDYLLHFNRAIDLYKRCELSDALMEADLTLLAAPTARARFNRAMILLAAGRWREGLHEYWECEQSSPFMRPQASHALSLGLRPWKGEPLSGKRVLLVHAHGFGDSIMMMRYVRDMPKTIMVMPPELRSLAEQCGIVVAEPIDCDFFAPILHLLYILNITPDIVSGAPYLHPPMRMTNKWHIDLGSKTRRRIGLAWSVGRPNVGDYPREIELGLLARALGGDAELHSVQSQGADAAADHGIIPHKLESFADCAGLMMAMDEIISVDTAALHLAGAIGHPKVTGLLSYWSSWRWGAKWYDNVKLCRQVSEGDWLSALDQRR
jgi:hypothetical protein